MTTVEAWHFVPEDKRLRYDDHRHVVVGELVTVDQGKLELCKFGLHASIKARDALGYAPGPIICRVRLSGKILESEDKLCASERTVIWMADATKTLHEFACWTAEQVVHLCGGDPRPRAAIQAKRDWLAGKISDKELVAARDAAWDAARDAAWDAARDAARAAASAAAWAAARAAQEKQLHSMLMALAPTEE